MPRTSDKGGKGAEERHEARNHDSKPTVLFEEVIELRHTLGRKSLDLARVDNTGTEETGNPIVGGVTQDSRSIEHQERCPKVQTTAIGREHTRREQKGVAGQEGEEHQTRFNEHDEKQRSVHPNRTQRYDPASNCATWIVK